MPRVQYGISSYKRGRGDLPELPVINMFAEDAPTEEGQVVLQSRPGLDDRSADMGTGPVTGLFKRDLVVGSFLYGVSGGNLYKGATLIGTIDGTGPVSMAGYENYLFVCAGKSIWVYDGSTLTTIAFPDSADVSKVLVAGSRLVAIRKDTGKFYWSSALGITIDALDFATAENSPDRLYDMVFQNAILMLFGAETVERWALGTNADLPFTPLQASVMRRGIRDTNCVAEIGPTFAWVTDKNQVCLQNEDTIISNPGLEERIEASTECSLFTFILGGVEFLALHIDNETQVWSWRSKLWSEFVSYGYSNWLPRCFAGGVFGSSVDGTTMEWGSGHQDLGGQLERRFRGGFPLNSGGITIANVQLRSNVGQTPFLTGDYTDPQVEMRLSRDAGQTWGDWRATYLGEQGNYREKVQWRACGMASQPGFLAEFRVTDPVPFRISDVLINENYGGR